MKFSFSAFLLSILILSSIAFVPSAQAVSANVVERPNRIIKRKQSLRRFRGTGVKLTPQKSRSIYRFPSAGAYWYR